MGRSNRDSGARRGANARAPSLARRAGDGSGRPSLAGQGVAVVFGDGGPVDDAPPGVEVVAALVLVAQVVGVLPDIDAEDGALAGHQRAVLVERAADAQL